VLVTPHTGPDSEVIVSDDASKYAIGAVLLQKDLLSSETHPIAYTAKMIKGAQVTHPARRDFPLSIRVTDFIRRPQ
jgi:hypothetical protein